MADKYLIQQEVPQVPPYEAAAMAEGLGLHLVQFLYPLLVVLNALLDKRLVRTFVRTVEVIIAFRDRANGLLLSELGGYLLGPEQAPAGTKRLSKLIHSSKWGPWLIEQFLFQQAEQRLQQWEQQGQEGLVPWDLSKIEKPETEASEDLGAVRSSKAGRLTRIKKGYYHPPCGPIFVPGMQWLGALLLGREAKQGAPMLVAMQWWTTRGVHASHQRDEEGRLLVKLAKAWGQRVIHLFDQGFAGAFWLGLWLAYALRFVLRWRGDYKLLDAQGNRKKAWQIAQGKRAWDSRLLWDSRGRRWYQASVLALPVRHPDYPDQPLFLVVCRGNNRSPWYLLTAEPVTTAEQAWAVVLAYMRRWQIEQTWRYDKSELAFESPRLWQWDDRVKLLLLATLASAFLLSLLEPFWEPMRRWLLRSFCHRTGTRCRRVKAPLYRLRSALSRLWLKYPPPWAASSRRLAAHAC